MFDVAGPVIVYGVSEGIVYGLVFVFKAPILKSDLQKRHKKYIPKASGFRDVYQITAELVIPGSQSEPCFPEMLPAGWRKMLCHSGFGQSDGWAPEYPSDNRTERPGCCRTIGEN